MQDIDVTEDQPAHRRGPALAAQAPDVRAVGPEDAPLDRQVLDRWLGWGAKPFSLPFRGDAVIVRADEAVADGHLARVADVQAVVVLAPGGADLHVAEVHLPAGGHDKRPFPGVFERDPLNERIRAFPEMQ